MCAKLVRSGFEKLTKGELIRDLCTVSQLKMSATTLKEDLEPLFGRQGLGERGLGEILRPTRTGPSRRGRCSLYRLIDCGSNVTPISPYASIPGQIVQKSSVEVCNS